MDLDAKIAWQGWEMPVMPDWRPLSMAGNREAGAMMIGLPQVPTLQVKWRRFRRKGLDATGWLMQRFRIRRPDGSAPLPCGFDSSAWKLGHALRRGGHLGIWIGASEASAAVVEVISTSLAGAELEEVVFRTCIPGMALRSPGEEWAWGINGIAFRVPGGFALARQHLYSGDIALEFIGPQGEALELRQVYPGELALSRRTMRRWLEASPFPSRRRQSRGHGAPWADATGRISGMVIPGRRLVPFPFHWARPRETSTIIAHDRELDRLLMAECSADAAAPGQAMAEKAIHGMNR
jgi:hypothetical protein